MRQEERRGREGVTGAQATTDATDENSRETQAEKGKEDRHSSGLTLAHTHCKTHADTQSYTHTGTYAQMSAHDHAKAASLGFSRVAASLSRSFPRLSIRRTARKDRPPTLIPRLASPHTHTHDVRSQAQYTYADAFSLPSGFCHCVLASAYPCVCVCMHFVIICDSLCE